MEKKLTSRQKQAIETKRRLYCSAVELFKEYPYEEVKVTDICKKANVSVGVFYHHFESKSHIFNEGYVSFDRDLQDFIKTIQDNDPIECIILIIKKYLDTIEKMGPLYRSIFLRNELEIKYDYIISNRRPFYKNLTEYVKKAISMNILSGDEIEISNDILRCIKGVVFDWSLRGGDFNLLEEGIKITNIILNNYFKIHI